MNFDNVSCTCTLASVRTLKKPLFKEDSSSLLLDRTKQMMLRKTREIRKNFKRTFSALHYTRLHLKLNVTCAQQPTDDLPEVSVNLLPWERVRRT